MPGLLWSGRLRNVTRLAVVEVASAAHQSTSVGDQMPRSGPRLRLWFGGVGVITVEKKTETTTSEYAGLAVSGLADCILR